MTNVLISLLARFLSLIPLLLVFVSVAWSYWEKKNTINGLRRTRIFLLILLVALIIDNLIFLIVSACALYDSNPYIVVPYVWTIFDKLIMTVALYCFYYLFKHAAGKD